jgi:NAD(P)-dependent dehydrogenase (short-subunit alcohol dehydrogenase family)
MDMEIRPDGRTALITGGSKGLGRAIATNFAAAGADVAILARNSRTLEDAKHAIGATAKGRVAAFACDVAKAGDIRAALRLRHEQFRQGRHSGQQCRRIANRQVRRDHR